MKTDDGVVGQSLGFDFVDESSDEGVHFFDHGGVNGVGQFAFVLGGSGAVFLNQGCFARERDVNLSLIHI